MRLRGLPESVQMALQALPAASHPMDVLRTGTSSLTLDPTGTIRSALLGVHFGDPAASLIMTPGDTIAVPSGASTAYCWNANKIGTLGNGGFVAFVAGLVAGVSPVYDGNVTRDPFVGLAFQGIVPSAAPTDDSFAGAFSTIGCRALRLTFSAIDAAGAYLAEPVDFAATVRFHVLTPRRLGRPNATSGRDPYDSFSLLPEPSLLSNAWASSSDNDLTISQTQRVFDFAVIGGSRYVGFRRTALAGTSVSHLHMIGEVF